MVYLDPFVIAPILNHIEAHPGCTITDLIAAFPDIDPKTMGHYLDCMKANDCIRKTSKSTKRRVRWEIVIFPNRFRQTLSDKIGEVEE